MNLRPIKKLLFAILISGVAWASAPNLYGQPVIKSHEIPVPSGGSQIGSVRSSEGAVLGPVSKPGATAESQPLPPVGGTLFEGFGFDDNATENAGFVSIPPDSSGAAGTDRVIAVVNRMIEARSKAGALLWRDSLKDFFSALGGATLGTRGFDPKVVYDQYEGRFVVVALERTDTADGDPSNESRILLAVSKDDTPDSATAADWNYHAIDSKTSIGGTDHWADYPGFEVDEEAVYITNNMFTFGAFAFGGVRLWIVGKGVVGGFYGGGAASVTVHDPYAGGGEATTTMPCQVFGAGGVGPGIGTFLVSHSGLNDGIDEFVQVVRVNNPLGAVSFTQEFVNIGDIDNVAVALPDAPQSGTGTLIEVNDRRALDCVWRDDRAWLTTTILPNSGPDAGETTAHWFKLDTSAVVDSTSVAGLITPDDQGDIGGEDIASNTTTFFPSVAVNSSGDAKFGFSASAATIFAGAFVTGRQAGDPAGTVQATETVKAGEDFYIRTFGGPRNRWGDYSGISLDPTDDGVFCVFNQFADTRGTVISGEDGRWGTAWGCFTFAEVHDLAAVKITAPKLVKVASAVTKSVKVQIQNRSNHNETVEAGDLGNGTSTGLVRLAVSVVDSDGETCQPAGVALDATKNDKIFAKGPKVLKPKAKLTVNYLVTYDCTNPLTMATGGDYKHEASVHHDVLDGNADSHAADDTCPYSVTPPFEIDDNPDGTIKDKGCGAKKADKTFGDPVVTDVVKK